MQEISQRRSINSDVPDFINRFKIDVIEFPNDSDILHEYASLCQFYGDGESACMSIARFNDYIIASSNTRDILSYCKNH